MTRKLDTEAVKVLKKRIGELEATIKWKNFLIKKLKNIIEIWEE